MTSELCAFIVGLICGLIIVVGLFVWWMGQHNSSPSVYEDEHRYTGSAEVIGITPSDQFVAPDMSLDIADTKAREDERGWGELRNDGTVVIHSAPFVASGDHLVNAEPIQVSLHTADPGVTDEQAEYGAAAYARKSVRWNSVSSGQRIDAIAFGVGPTVKDFVTVDEYLEYWRELDVDPFELGRLINRHRHDAAHADTPMRTEPDNGLWHEWSLKCVDVGCAYLLPSELRNRERAPSDE